MPEAFAPLVGTHFRPSEAKHLVNALQPGDDQFEFEREPDNPHDSNAVRVLISGEHVGYLARVNNNSVANAMDNGATLHGTVVDFEGRKPVLHIVWEDIEAEFES